MTEEGMGTPKELNEAEKYFEELCKSMPPIEVVKDYAPNKAKEVREVSRTELEEHFYFFYPGAMFMYDKGLEIDESFAITVKDDGVMNALNKFMEEEGCGLGLDSDCFGKTHVFYRYAGFSFEYAGTIDEVRESILEYLNDIEKGSRIIRELLFR